MREEISAAVVFITRLVRQNGDVSKEKVEEFSDCLSAILVEKFQNHWYSDHPTKGQGYRCIRINDFEPKDPVLEKAASESGLRYWDLHLPPELTLWVDPEDVCCRLGESRGTICTLAAKKDGSLENRAHSINIEELLQEGQERHNQEVNIVTTRSNHSNSNYRGNHFTKGLHHGANSNFYSKQQHNYFNNQQFQMTHNRFRPSNKNNNRRHPQVQEQVNGVRHSPEHVNEVRQQFLAQVTTAARGSDNDKPVQPKPINPMDVSSSSTTSSSSSSTDKSNINSPSSTTSQLNTANKSGNSTQTKSSGSSNKTGNSNLTQPSGATNKGGNSNPTSNQSGPKSTQPKGKTTNQGVSSVNQGIKPGSYNGGKSHQSKGGYPHLNNQKVAQKVF
ncbi:hypothetical protein FSP39_019212 [Pinctada imbricata]|uniref:Anti-proliferative protein domain-containing protein n=1 Tax=Pinctada imbricata TaxID=66713 RepID=A0AA88YSL2_PINIB|nr:hypothetical protein FSP39_019212 [Pinctada imbricata]